MLGKRYCCNYVHFDVGNVFDSTYSIKNGGEGGGGGYFWKIESSVKYTAKNSYTASFKQVLE